MTNVPNLRFPEFKDNWKMVTVPEMLRENKGAIKIGPFGSALKKEYYVDQGIKVYAQENVFNKNFDIGHYYITDEKYQSLKSCELEPGDLVVSMMGTIGSCAIFPSDAEKGIMNSHLLRLQFKEEYDVRVIENLLKNSYSIKKQILRLSVGSIMDGLSSSVIKELEFTLPSNAEQEKIASFFSLIDKKIELQTKKVEELKNYKKGIVQKIFSQELRFKDENGNEYPNWKEYKVKDLFDVTRGVVIAKNEISDKSNETFKYAVYSSQTSNDGILGYDQTFDFDGNYLTWTTDGANAGRVFRRSGKFRCTNVCGVLVEKNNTIGYANKLVAEILNKETPKHVSYVGNPKLMNGVMAEIKLSMPSLEEQTKIDKLINQLDIKIENEQMKLSLLVDYKKGLLQQMFI